MEARPIRLLVILFGFLIVLSACAQSDDQLPASATWEEPAWMAQARQDVEEYQIAAVACFARHGVAVEIGTGAGMVAPTLDISGMTQVEIEQLDELISVAMEECGAEVPLPSLWLSGQDLQAYNLMLDVRECIIAHGFELAEPPAFEIWSEQSQPWMPFNELNGIQQIGNDQLVQLSRACPQSGTFLFDVWPAPGN